MTVVIETQAIKCELTTCLTSTECNSRYLDQSAVDIKPLWRNRLEGVIGMMTLDL